MNKLLLGSALALGIATAPATVIEVDHGTTMKLVISGFNHYNGFLAAYGWALGPEGYSHGGYGTGGFGGTMIWTDLFDHFPTAEVKIRWDFTGTPYELHYINFLGETLFETTGAEMLKGCVILTVLPGTPPGDPPREIDFWGRSHVPEGGSSVWLMFLALGGMSACAFPWRRA